jgi:hypothetical protein
VSGSDSPVVAAAFTFKAHVSPADPPPPYSAHVEPLPCVVPSREKLPMVQSLFDYQWATEWEHELHEAVARDQARVAMFSFGNKTDNM